MFHMTWLQNISLRRVAPAVIFALAAVCAHAQAPPPIIGDINGDGNIDILDVQGAANIALGSGENVPPADTDENAVVDVLDVQVLVNTALGVGGLVQPVIGTFTPAKDAKDAGPVKAVALSTDGRKIEADVDPATGAFELSLPVRTSWSIGFVSADTGDTVGTVSFPIAEDNSSSLPLPGLSNGNIVDLGAISSGIAAETSEDMRTLLGERADPLDIADNDGNGVSDLFQGLLLPYPWDVPGSGISIPQGLDINVLQQKMAKCLEDATAVVSIPDLTGIEIQGIPAFVAPLIYCYTTELYDWLGDGGLNVLQVANLTVKILAATEPRINPWLASLNVPDLTDTNGNHVPDYIEDEYCDSGSGKLNACDLDANANGIPDFVEDSDHDDIPNFLDTDNRTADDADGDGISNTDDLDDDNDNVLDYADASPTVK